ncbi:MAG: hypothetical protein L0332_08775 [Chloroflexi bacterium]|nr:hypothetical protein [Chloroflexota bacterium]MCI0576678.1 hypothetical protein [Chloroflexota bacterium]MCI0647991.1 hypothetical protein [Chloroflexota bacterium]MCI0726799.1 hypothetical protein [Chloroflexota bacterium]
MTTVTLAPDLAEEIENLTGKDHADTQAFVEKAIRAYLIQLRREIIRTETEAFNAQYEQLRARHPGQYVAIHQGQVIDHDSDLRTLHLRVYEQLDRTPVLLKQVTDEPERELIFRSPHLERSK